MPIATGTARSPTELMNILNNHLVANGWTKIRGDADLTCASPKAARYWRLLVWETQTTTSSTRGLQLFNLRTTAGGANVATNDANMSCSNFAVGSPNLLVAGGLVRSANIGTGTPWWVVYDFGAPTTVREVYFRADSTIGPTPRSFAIQWSHDNKTWTTMDVRENVSIGANAYYTMTLADGFVNAQHVAAGCPRRSGSREDLIIDANYETSNHRDMSEDVWVWQGPGYDASRRVYVHMRGHCNAATATHVIEMNYSANYDSGLVDFFGHEGMSGTSVFHIMGSGTITYWIYSNSHRVVLITKTGSTDYASSYIGFLSAFSTPDNYPFPLFMSSSASARSITQTEMNGAWGSMVDPGFNCCCLRKWDTLNTLGGNRSNNSTDGYSVGGLSLYPQVWPMHFGKSGTNSRWPLGRGAGTTGTLYTFQHMFESLIATQQSELPLFPAIVYDRQHGNIGAMTGCYALPGGGILAAEQVITIGASTYKVFPNRNRRGGSSWFAVKEE